MASETKACSTWLSMGRRNPAMRATFEVLPATAMPILRALMSPREVRTPAIRPPSRMNPVTSQF